MLDGRIRNIFNKIEEGQAESKKYTDENANSLLDKIGALEGQFGIVKNMNNKFVTQTEFKMKSFTE